MELPQIGRQCSVTDCKQLDFLPLECSCKLMFCRNHFLLHVEYCSTQKHEKNAVQSIEKYYECAEVGCSEKSIVPLICDKCNRHFCITHRHITGCTKVDEKIIQEAIDRCNAPKKQFQEAKVAADKEVEFSINNAKRKGKNIETANKIQLMRLKAKANGEKSIPTSDRLYFLIFNNKYCPEGRAIFISRDWTVGRSIDAIAAECKIPNNNNKLSAPKLRLLKKDTNKIIANDMCHKINSFISDFTLINGESLILDYVEN